MKKLKYLLLGFAALAIVACGGPKEEVVVEETTETEVVEEVVEEVIEDDVVEEAAQ